MPRVINAPGKERAPKFARQELEALQIQKWVESKINQGMITSIEPQNLPTNAMQFIKNATVRYDVTAQRPGLVISSPSKPDSQPVLKYVSWKTEDGTGFTIRIAGPVTVTPTSVNLLAGGTWTPLVVAPPLTGLDTDYITTTDVLDTFIFADNGADPLQVVDPVGLTVGPLGDAPAYRYVTGFFNRAVGFARANANEIEVGWSGSSNVTEWNPAVDDTAGSSPLINSPADVSDFIKGGFAFSNVMIILREKSIWLANTQPVAQNPFFFYSAVPGIGCNCPYSAQLVQNGLSWVDQRTNTVYYYTPGDTPSPIGQPIENTIMSNIDDPNSVFSSYDPINKEYTVFIPAVSSQIVQAWKFNFRTNAWTYNEYELITSSGNTDLESGGVRVEDLVGTVAGLMGTVEDLSPSNSTLSTQWYGDASGNLYSENINTITDNGDPFSTQLVSKLFKLPEFDIYVGKLVFEYQVNTTGTILLEYSLDGGNTWITGKMVTPVAVGKPALLILRRMIKCRIFMWRLTMTAGQFNLFSYEVHTYPSGESRDRS